MALLRDMVFFSIFRIMYSFKHDLRRGIRRLQKIIVYVVYAPSGTFFCLKTLCFGKCEDFSLSNIVYTEHRPRHDYPYYLVFSYWHIHFGPLFRVEKRNEISSLRQAQKLHDNIPRFSRSLLHSAPLALFSYDFSYCYFTFNSKSETNQRLDH